MLRGLVLYWVAAHFPAVAAAVRFVAFAMLYTPASPGALTSCPMPAAGCFHVDDFPDETRDSFLVMAQGAYIFSLSKIQVLSCGCDLALNRPVSIDLIIGNPKDAQQLTRTPRRKGGGIVTDNPTNNCTGSWKPVPFRARSPRGG